MKISSAETFKIGNYKYYSGPNPYLDSGALVFDFSLITPAKPLSIEEYFLVLSQFLPDLQRSKLISYGDLYAEILRILSPLEMDLHCCRVRLYDCTDKYCLALESLHYSTSKKIVETVWLWLEKITQGKTIDYAADLRSLQQQFSSSIYGNPTVYSLLTAAYKRNIPYFLIWEEGLIQYGYGKHQIRGLSTIFDTDSLLDSDLTTQKDDCKDFLANLGFPIPKGKIVYTPQEALEVVLEIGYPVAIKPVAGHEGIGVTANISSQEGLITAYTKAVSSLETEDTPPVILEQSLSGSDFRLLCINKRFVAALERCPPYVVGDGYSTLSALITKENQTTARQDTPISPLTKIIVDEGLLNYIKEQDLSLESIIAAGEKVYLRQVANISAGGVSIDVTPIIHEDNRQLAEDIAEYLKITCFGIDIITTDISRSWKEGNFGIIEINASPGVFMHLRPAQGDSINVPGQILDFFFPDNKPCRIPIVTFNRLNQQEILVIVEYLLSLHPDYLIGSISHQGIWLNQREKILQHPYNLNVQGFLRHPQLNLLLAEYPETIFTQEGLFYQNSDLVVLVEPTETEMLLADSLLTNGTLIVKRNNTLELKNSQTTEIYQLRNLDQYLTICCQNINAFL